ncbi:UDP-2,4-diacetamido-2,4,6-trideoxy-beta-L-altropyranose hydrolase [Natrinema halophilum]|uniref:UDP-2,4-diacetamido-2,4, 6-trideoxy-beta-L-altropyranose hydrolase n=1 Tax=Natrinema halophilum TaxID=1699371 RepID=A0A7D5GH89_9EURY|nr:UDP-2,4-diacetamido-2,4,6-trideoxy-beta-L-altropyranose hydrolase [Natrinema halophilum]QLG48894.1 UDP-2,4-diacetamido-2,4,6-trideoxy-beta-L-altropyranose hydrolase [Natrinema halophilum]
MDVVLRVDGGSKIGYGHLVRTGALADELHARGHTITVATTTPAPAQEVFPSGSTTVDLPSRGDPEPFVEWLDSTTVDVVFTDAYPVDTAYQQAIRQRVPLAVLQDDARHAVCADLFVNGNLYGPNQNYEFIGDLPETCLGTKYVLLRRQIRRRAAEEPPWREKPERALVTMGGSDIASLTPTVVRAFDGLDLRVDAIVGPGCTEAQERSVLEAATEIEADVRVVRDPDDLADRMLASDFAVSTASSTTYELLALGTPLVSIAVVDNQEPIATALREQDIATVLPRDADETTLRSAIEVYVTDAERRQRRQKHGKELVDGRGTERVCAEVLSIAENHPDT